MSNYKFKHMKKLLLLTIGIVSFYSNSAQTTQLFSEDFEITNGFTLNSGGPSTAVGNNKWTVNNTYLGAPTYNNTMREDSTYGGSITFAPFSKYLHIFDNASGISNANFDASSASDNFTYLTNGICTLGMDSVKFSFFYLCEGNSNAHGEVYYSLNNGTWIQIGQSAYNNKYKWKHETITNPAFANQSNLRFGFRWVNGSGTPPSNESFAIDDINVSATYASNSVTVTVDSISPSSICQGNFAYIYYHLSDTLCDGAYTILLSNASGVFPGTNSWIFNMYYPQTSGIISIQLPNTVTTGPCYKIRIDRTTPFPAITGVASPCFAVTACANTITAQQPIATFDTNAVCIGSALDVPFWSTGVFLANTYYAQLSDSSGNFPIIPNIIGSSVNSTTYSPSLPPYQPGSIHGTVPNVAPGCNYYIRVVSTNPISTVSSWGPFCIGQCDIRTNNSQDLHFCITDCAVSPMGSDTTITLAVHAFNPNATYGSGNTFTTQLLSSSNFSHIGANGIFGSVVATSDTTLSVHVPCMDSLGISGIPLGMNYLRVVATNTNQPDNALGSLIRVTIGGTHATGPTVSTLDYTTFTTKDTFCVGDQVYPVFSPYNYLDYSSYTWIISGYNGGAPFQNAQGANSNNTGFVFTFNPGVYTLKVQETNNGCVGPYGQASTMVVTGPPSPMSVVGPSPVCQGDTATYHASFYDGTFYTWSQTNGSIVSTSNDTIEASFPTSGTSQIHVNAINQCGNASFTKTVLIAPIPAVPTITVSGNLLTSSSTTGNHWYLNGVSITGATAQTYTYSTLGVYTVVVTSGSCSSSSSPFNATGVDEVTLNNSVSIYPNPFSTQTIVSFAQKQSNTTIVLSDILGKEVRTMYFSGSEFVIEKGNLNEGVYFVKIVDENKNVINRKIIIQ